MSDTLVFAVVLVAKLVTEMAGRYGDNYYLTGQAFRSAALTTLVAGLAVPVGRMVMTDRNDIAAAAVLVAVFVTTFIGSRDLVSRQSSF